MLNINNTSQEKLQEKITAMREGGKILGNLLRDLKAHVQPGMTGKSSSAVLGLPMTCWTTISQVPSVSA